MDSALPLDQSQIARAAEEKIVEHGNQYTVQIFSGFEDAEDAWKQFEQNADYYIFQSFDWLVNWYKFIGSKSDLRICPVLVRDHESSPLLFLPLGILKTKLFSCLTWLGGGTADYCGPILSQDCCTTMTTEVFHVIWNRIQEQLPFFDVIHFDKLLEPMERQVNPFLSLSCRPNPQNVHLAQLGGNWHSYNDSRKGAKSRKTMRRNRRRLAEHGRLEFVVATETEDIHQIVGEMILQKSKKYNKTGAVDIFANEGYREFYTYMAISHCKNSFVHLSALKLDDRILATHWGAILNQRFYYLMPTYSDGKFKKYSPGSMLLEFLIEWCCDNNIHIFDFTIGGEQYKNAWSTDEYRLYDHLHAVTARGRYYVLWERIFASFRKFVRGSPRLFFVVKMSRRYRNRLRAGSRKV